MKIMETKRTYKFRIRMHGLAIPVKLAWLQFALMGIEHEEDSVTWVEEEETWSDGWTPKQTKRIDRMSKIISKRLTDSEFKEYMKEIMNEKESGVKLQKHKKTGLILIDFDYEEV